ncbi:efflux RND transporter periplasmic adaptor subunit [Thalassotalea litorea]|uniref:Efflux RND transporter periplasmic adaptor subunit n=1 Tax=Thalassotalea litorea TaxID=2020715 RepID=A0A5R9IRR9_9GAMM|nr:efflux RND transporter periplasmic adaptor subunit [Thalassotalea litorea]TLU66757.1 efflux RND transporter periplasmic adaptor subunit [Thalassotalea litorea]
MSSVSSDFQQQNSKTKSQRSIFVVLAPFIIVAFGFAGCVGLSAMAEKPEKKPSLAKLPVVEVAEITKQDVTFTIHSQGTVMPRTETALISEVSGQITFVADKMKVGGFFKKGEVLMEIDPITYQVGVLEAQSRLDAAKATLVEEKARADQAEDEWQLTGKPLSEAPVLALRLPQLQRAMADAEAATADMQGAQLKLKRTKIIAPYDALIKAKYVDIGQYVGTGTQLVDTFAVDYAEVRLPVKQQDIGFIKLPKVNQQGDASNTVVVSTQQGLRTLTWDSYISRYEGVVNDRSRVHYLVAHIDDPYNLLTEERDVELRMGMFVKASIKGKSYSDITAIPRSAIRGAGQLYLIDPENRLKIVTVDVLRSDKDYAYIQGDIVAGNRVVTTRLETPVQGMELRVSGEEVEQNEVSEPAEAEKANDAQTSNATETQQTSTRVE